MEKKKNTVRKIIIIILILVILGLLIINLNFLYNTLKETFITKSIVERIIGTIGLNKVYGPLDGNFYCIPICDSISCYDGCGGVCLNCDEKSSKGVIKNKDNKNSINNNLDEWKCEPWSDCMANYDLETLIDKNVILKGVMSRRCDRTNTRSIYIIQKIECDPRVPINIKKISKCFKDYYEVFNLEGNLISKIELINPNSKKIELNIHFNLDNSDYCDYCHDSIKDFDEDNVDCSNKLGSNCPKC